MRHIITLAFALIMCQLTAQKPATKTNSTSNQVQATKTVTVSYSYGTSVEGWDGLIFLTENNDEMRFLNKDNKGQIIDAFWNSEKTGGGTEDDIAEYYTVKSKVGKKYKVVYTTKKVKYPGMVAGEFTYENENIIIGFSLIGADDVSKATCKVFEKGELISIVEGSKVFKIDSDGKKGYEKTIQNKNEYCKDQRCIRVEIDKEGVINIYNLPNTTDKKVIGKFSGNKILRWRKPYGSGEGGFDDCGIVYSGDKLQAALTVIIHNFCR